MPFYQPKKKEEEEQDRFGGPPNKPEQPKAEPPKPPAPVKDKDKDKESEADYRKVYEQLAGGALPKPGPIYVGGQKEGYRTPYQGMEQPPGQAPVTPPTAYLPTILKTGPQGTDVSTLPIAGPEIPAGLPARAQDTVTGPQPPPALTAGAGPAAAPAEGGGAGPETEVDWTALGFGSQGEGEGWARAFAAEHGGNLPWEEGTMSPQQNLQEHLAALGWGQEFQQMTGRQPTPYDYGNEWYRSRFGLGSNWGIEGAARGGGMGFVPWGPGGLLEPERRGHVSGTGNRNTGPPTRRVSNIGGGV